MIDYERLLELHRGGDLDASARLAVLSQRLGEHADHRSAIAALARGQGWVADAGPALRPGNVEEVAERVAVGGIIAERVAWLDDARLLTRSRDTLRVLDAETLQVRALLEPRARILGGVRVWAGRVLFATALGQLQLWDPARDERHSLGTCAHLRGPSFALSRDARWMVCATSPSEVVLWRMLPDATDAFSQPHARRACSEPLTSVHVDGDGDRVLLVYPHACTLYKRLPRRLEAVRTWALPRAGQPLRQIAFAPDGDSAALRYDTAIWIADADLREPYRATDADTRALIYTEERGLVAGDRSGRVIARIGIPGSRLITVRRDQPVLHLEPRGEGLLVATRSAVVLLDDALKPRWSLDLPDERRLTGATRSPDGARVACLERDGHLRVLSADNPRRCLASNASSPPPLGVAACVARRAPFALTISSEAEWIVWALLPRLQLIRRLPLTPTEAIEAALPDTLRGDYGVTQRLSDDWYADYSDRVGSPHAVAMHPDGHLLAGCERGIFVCVRGLDEGALRWVAIPDPFANLIHLRATPDGRGLLLGGGGALELRDFDSGALVRRFAPGPLSDINAIALDPEGRWVAASCWDTTLTTVFALETGEVRLDGYGAAGDEGAFHPVSCATFLPGHRLVVASRDAPWLSVRDITSRDALRVRWRGAPAACVAASPDGSLLAVGCDEGDARIRLFDAERGEPLAELVGHQGAVTHLAFTPDGRALISSGDTTMRIWTRPPE